MEKTEGKIRYGLIGIGAQGGSYARFLTNAPAPFPGMVCAPCPDNCALGALCDIDPEKEKMCKEQYPDVPFFKDWKDMIASGTVDAIITTVPHYLHHEISIYAMEHGMNVLCEKPAGVRSKDVQKMIACAKAHPEVSFGIMFNQRTNKLYQKIKEIVASGELGEIRRSQWMINSWWRPDSYYQQSAWRATWGGEGGGVLVNQAPHQLDLLLWYMGDVDEVYGVWKNLNHPYIEVEDTAVAVVKFKSGAVGNIVVSNSQNPALYGKVHVFGENGAGVGVQTDGGAMFIAGMSTITEPPYNDLWTVEGEADKLEDWKKGDCDFFNSVDSMYYYHQEQIKDFLHAVETHTKPLVDARDGRKTVELFEAIYRSTQTNSVIKFPIR